jgi:hypothetical protein
MVCCHWLFHPSAPVEQPQAEPQQPPAPSVQPPQAVHAASEAGADSLGASFQQARHTLRDVHSFRLGPSELVLRHSVDGGRSALSESEQQPRRTRAAARVTRCVAIGTDAGGRKCVNQYVKVRKLAQGSYGKVVLYSCREDGNVYAIKVLSKSHLGRKYVSHGVTALTDAMREVCVERTKYVVCYSTSSHHVVLLTAGFDAGCTSPGAGPSEHCPPGGGTCVAGA